MPSEIAAASWRCSCGGRLRYDYHVVWRCDGCGAAFDIAPGLTQALPMIRVSLGAGAEAFNEEMRGVINAVRALG